MDENKENLDESNSDSKNILNTLKKIKVLLRHIKLVQDACEVIGTKLIESGEIELGKNLIAKSLIHDNSKFYGLEWTILMSYDEYKDDDVEKLEMAIFQHINTNDHHPEYWGDINSMPKICIAEMVADWYARSNEFGTDLRKWIKNTALEKYNISPHGVKYKEIKKFVDLLLEKPFS